MGLYSHVTPDEHPLSLDELEMHAPNSGVVISLGSVAYGVAWFAMLVGLMWVCYLIVSPIVSAAINIAALAFKAISF